MNVLVTGGGRGIGEAIVRALSKNYKVAFTYNHSEEKARALEKELNGRVKAFKCDVSSSADVNRAIDEIRTSFGKIHMLVNNAGVSGSKLFQDITDEEWARVTGVNLNGTFYVTRAVVPDMINAGFGRIVNVSSMWGISGASMETSYSASKAGVIGLTKALAQELAPSGITVNAVAPGAIDTDMMKEYAPEEISAFASTVPLGRLGTPEEIASAVEFLLSASYVTGEILSVTGGY